MGIETALIGAFGLVSAVSGIAGSVSSSKAAKEAAKRQEQYYDKAKAGAEAQKAYYQQQLADWRSMFGNVETQVTDYFNNLSPAVRQSQYFQRLEQNYAASSQRLNETLAQRGLSSSGIVAATNTQLLQNLASNKAQAAIQAQDEVAQQKLGFYQLGLGQKNRLQAGYDNAVNQQINLNAQMAGVAGQQAAAYEQQATQGIINAGSALGQAAGSIASALGNSAGGAGGNLNNANSAPATTTAPIPQARPSYQVAPDYALAFNNYNNFTRQG